MRGRSPGAMPDAGVGTTMVTARPSPLALMSTAAAGVGVLHGVLDQVRQHLPQPRPVGEHHRSAGTPASMSTPRPRPRRDRARSPRSPTAATRARSPAAARIVPVSASEMSMSAVSVAPSRSASSSAAPAPSGDPPRVVGGQRRLGHVAEARQRRAQIVRDVVERAAHAVDRAPDCVQHLVDAARRARRADRAVPRIGTRASNRPRLQDGSHASPQIARSGASADAW